MGAFSWQVIAEESGQKLLLFVSQRLNGSYSANFLKKVINGNGCSINGRVERFASTFVGEGDQVTIRLPEVLPQSLNLFDTKRILFEDDAFLIYNKPAGITCDAKGIGVLLASYLSGLQLVHRLDRDTTGALIIAKNTKVFHNFVEQFREYRIQKRYLTIVDGIPKKKLGTIENYLGKKKEYSGQVIWGSVEKEKGVYACTKWEVLESVQNASLVVCKPKTGRTHQIRIHMAEMGHPLLGDFQYGKDFRCPIQPSRILLHAASLEFQHPLTNMPIQASAPIPIDFQQLHFVSLEKENIK